MSNQIYFLEIKQLPSGSEKNQEEFHIRQTCEKCHGAQGRWVSAPYIDEWENCPVCDGSGEMEAKVTVEWYPAGGVNGL